MDYKHTKILDCTLRDGAYLVDKKFGSETITGIINGLVDTGVDIIEIGFLQNEGLEDGKTVFFKSSDAEKYLPQDRKNSEFAVLADYSRYSVDNLDSCTGRSFTIVRECFFKSERFAALNACKKIKEKGYKLFIQPVDILGYSDTELLEFIYMVNEIQPYALSIVDTFGSMYMEDLERVFALIDHNLSKECRIGFHSHNNLQMSSALSQDFLKISFGKRNVVIDTTICGMGRGAGNTPTELIIEYMNKYMGYHYELDSLLDIVDVYFGAIFSRCSWGYSIPLFIAGMNSAHVNNVAYLTERNSIQSKDIRYILNHIDKNTRKRYDYDLLQKEYINRISVKYEDDVSINKLKEIFYKKELLILCPGQSISSNENQIKDYINENQPLIIAVNFIPEHIKADFLYFSNIKRFSFWKQNDKFYDYAHIITSNIAEDKYISDSTIVVSFEKLIKCGWNYMDNSIILLLRLLDKLDIKSINIAGLDGFFSNSSDNKNFCQGQMELLPNDVLLLNQEILEMLIDYRETRVNDTPINFVTPS